MSARGNSKFIHNGYVYNFDCASRKDEAIKFWRCERKSDCNGRIHTREDQLLKVVSAHSHGPSAARVEVAEVRSSLKRRAESDTHAASTIVTDITRSASLAACAALPSPSAMKQSIRRYRNKDRFLLRDPLLRNGRGVQIRTSEESRGVMQESAEESFLIADSGSEQQSERILIFGKQSWTSILEESETCYVDGTFPAAPPHFGKIYVLMGDKLGVVVPVLYILLPDDSHARLVSMFAMVREHLPNFSPRVVACGYNATEMAAVKESFPDADVTACFFHLAHKFHIKLRELGLEASYSSCADTEISIKMILSLAFVPIINTDVYLDALALHLPASLQPLLMWFEDNFVGRPLRLLKGRGNAAFPHTMWNEFANVYTVDRERFGSPTHQHKRLYAELSVRHDKMLLFVNALKKLQRDSDKLLVKAHAANRDLPRGIRLALDRLYETVLGFGNKEPLDYLRQIALTFE
ncbi:MAG: hypothetical protein AAFP26_12255, partial [Planctomycetota bacterium]